jgi:hypothetical protein
MCNDCQNEWHNVLCADPIWVRQGQLEARRLHFQSLSFASTPVAESQWQQFSTDDQALQAEAFKLAEVFCQPLPSYLERKHKMSRDALKREMNIVAADDTAAR